MNLFVCVCVLQKQINPFKICRKNFIISITRHVFKKRKYCHHFMQVDRTFEMLLNEWWHRHYGSGVEHILYYDVLMCATIIHHHKVLLSFAFKKKKNIMIHHYGKIELDNRKTIPLDYMDIGSEQLQVKCFIFNMFSSDNETCECNFINSAHWIVLLA